MQDVKMTHREWGEKAGCCYRAIGVTFFVDVDRLLILAIRRSSPDKTTCDLSQDVDYKNVGHESKSDWTGSKQTHWALFSRRSSSRKPRQELSIFR